MSSTTHLVIAYQEGGHASVHPSDGTKLSKKDAQRRATEMVQKTGDVFVSAEVVEVVMTLNNTRRVLQSGLGQL